MVTYCWNLEAWMDPGNRGNPGNLSLRQIIFFNRVIDKIIVSNIFVQHCYNPDFIINILKFNHIFCNSSKLQSRFFKAYLFLENSLVCS